MVEFVESVKASFADSDKKIRDFEARKAELERQIEADGGDMTVMSVQNTVAARAELQQIEAALAKVKADRDGKAKAAEQKLRMEMSQAGEDFRKFSQEALSDDVKAIWESTTALRRQIFDLYQKNRELHSEFMTAMRGLGDTLDTKRVYDCASSSLFSDVVSPFHLPTEHTSGTYKAIKGIYDNCHYYEHEFKED